MNKEYPLGFLIAGDGVCACAYTTWLRNVRRGDTRGVKLAELDIATIVAIAYAKLAGGFQAWRDV